eukprot:jgi/Astpho2/8137/fgenesh1_pg.00120_%23_81_t
MPSMCLACPACPIPAVSCQNCVRTGDGNSDHLEEKIPAPGSIKLAEGTWQLGRDKPADIVVPVPTVSGRHAQLKVEGSKVQVTDLGSTNGTFVNDQELTADKTVDLAVGTEVTFGDDHLAKFVLQEE